MLTITLTVGLKDYQKWRLCLVSSMNGLPQCTQETHQAKQIKEFVMNKTERSTRLYWNIDSPELNWLVEILKSILVLASLTWLTAKATSMNHH